MWSLEYHHKLSHDLLYFMMLGSLLAPTSLMVRKQFLGFFKDWKAQPPKLFLTIFLATGLAVERFDLFGNQARTAAKTLPPEIQAYQLYRSKLALRKVSTGKQDTEPT